MRNLTTLIGTLINDADGIAEAQTLAGADSLDLDGVLVADGIVVLTYPQFGTITSSGDDTGITFTWTGLDPDGALVSQAVTGSNASTASTTVAFSEVHSIVTSGATTGDVEAGVLTANGAVSRSLRVNGQQPNFKLGLFADVVSGTLTYSAQYAYEQPEDEYAISYSGSADWRNVDGLTSLTSDAVSNLFYKVNAVRLKVTAYTSGSVRLTATQSM